MELLNLISDNLPVFIILILILIINFCCILYLVFKERKEDKQEINEILNDMNPKLEIEQDQKVEENKKEVEEMLMKMQQDLEAKPGGDKLMGNGAMIPAELVGTQYTKSANEGGDNNGEE